MTEQKPPEGNLSAEFRKLGENLADMLRSAWDSPERKKLQSEIESGLTELGNTVRKEVDGFSESPTGQRLKGEVQDLSNRIRTGEAEARVRTELLEALRRANQELEKFAQRAAGGSGGQSSGSTQSSGGSPKPEDQAGSPTSVQQEAMKEVHPDDVESKGTIDPEKEIHQEVHPDDVESGPQPTSG